MNRYISRSAVLLLLALVGLVGCGGGNGFNIADVDAEQTITAVPSLGRIRNGVARAFAANGDPLSDEVTTGSSGRAELRIPANHRGPVLIRVRGQQGATYFDEALGTDTDMGEDVEIRAWLPEPQAEAGVSILTELAARLVEAGGGTIDAAAIEAANEQIRAALAPDVANLLTPPILVDEDTAAGDLDDSDGGKLAVRLAALAELAEGDAAPALAILTQLAADVADGVIDGRNGDTAIAGLSYSPATFEDDFVAAVRDFAASFGNEALRNAVGNDEAVRGDSSLLPGAGGGDGGDGDGDGDGGDGGNGGGTGGGDNDGINGDTAPATINAAFIGEYTLVYYDNSPESSREPYTEGQELNVSISANGELTIGDLTLTDPFNRFLGGDTPHLPEIIWLDAATGIEYALSDNQTGSFNEINVGDAQLPQGPFGLPSFLGQIREAEGDGSEGVEAVSAIAGNFSMVVVEACAALTGICTEATAPGEMIDVLIGDDGTVTFAGTQLDVAAATDFRDNRSSIEPRLTFTLPGADDTETFTLEIYVNPAFAGAGSVDAAELTQTVGSGGVFSSRAVYAELPETRAQFTDFFASLRSVLPLTMTVIEEDPNYPSRMQNAVGFLPGAGTPLCRSFVLEEAEALSSLQPQFSVSLNGEDAFRFNYQRSISRFRSIGDERTMSFQGGQLVIDGGTVRLEEGLLSAGAGNFVSPIQAIASSNEADIAEACSDFSDLTVEVTTDGSTNGRINVRDLAEGGDGQLLFQQRFTTAGAETVSLSLGLPTGTEYRVDIDSLLVKSAFDQVCSEESGTLNTDAVVEILCAAPDPELL